MVTPAPRNREQAGRAGTVRRNRPSRSRSRSSAGPPPSPSKTRPPRCAGRSARPRSGCRPAGSSPPGTGTSSPAAWTWNSAATTTPGGSSPTPASPRRRPGRPAGRSRRPGPEFAAVIVRRHRALRPGHLQRAQTGKGTVRPGHPAVRHRRAGRHRGVNATTILVRRVKQGIAEWYRFQLKEKGWKGLVEHALDGWNIGPAPYGYTPERIPHPIPLKAAQGRTKTRLDPGPGPRPVVAQIFTWRVIDSSASPPSPPG